MWIFTDAKVEFVFGKWNYTLIYLLRLRKSDNKLFSEEFALRIITQDQAVLQDWLLQCFPVCGIALWYSFTLSVSQASPGNTENLVLNKDTIQLSTSYQRDINASAVNLSYSGLKALSGICFLTDSWICGTKLLLMKSQVPFMECLNHWPSSKLALKILCM